MKCILRRFACLAVVVCAARGYGATPVSESIPKPASPAAAPSSPTSNVVLPGPLRPLLRMAGISQLVSPEEVLPLLARNVALRGNDNGHPNEFLLLLQRYVFQARELQRLAGQENTLRVHGCRDAGLLLQVLGYRMRGECGQKDLVLETAEPQRAFLTADSGFPLPELEEALEKDAPFTYPYQGSLVPMLLEDRDWSVLALSQKSGPNRRSGSILDILLDDQGIARLYWALSKKDPDTQMALVRTLGLKKLLPDGPALDLYGGELTIREGRVLVPGGQSAEPMWRDLVGANPESPGEFAQRLLTRDTGWMAAYYDVVSRLSPAQQEHLLQGKRLKAIYEAYRKPDSEREATKGIYRKDADLLVLLTRLRWEGDGEPHVPGNLDVWKEVFAQKTDSATIREMGRRARSWQQPEQLLEALASCARVYTDAGPVQIYLQLSELDAARPADRQLTPAMVRLLASNFAQLSSWYPMFSEFPQLDDAAIMQFIATTAAIDRITNQNLRGNVRGALQANVGIWQILVRQGEIPAASLESSWQKTLEPFAKIGSSVQLFDATQSSLAEIFYAATGKREVTEGELIGLLAGPRQDSVDGQMVRQTLAERMQSVLEDQQLVSLDTLFALGEGLDQMAKGAKPEGDLVSLSGELREFELPRPIFTNTEKGIWAPAIYNTRHDELRVRTDLARLIKNGSHAQLAAARGQLAPFLKDTLVGLNYAYYEPPDAQILHNNPLFVRSHDFTGISTVGATQLWQTPRLLAAGMPAGGGAFFMGSLADLSYMLATAEQDFIVPVHVQALIWKELVPDLLLNATLPRWWNISADEMHAVALYQKRGEELVVASAENGELQSRTFAILADKMEPSGLERIRAVLHTKTPSAVVSKLLPADMFYLAGQFQEKYPAEAAQWGPVGQQLSEMRQRLPEQTSWELLARDFGVPHRALAMTYARGLVNVKPLPFYSGYSSRLFAESWESSNLYWARIADEKGYSPVMLNLLVPELTRRMVTNIFATTLDDWPAVLRAMRDTGEEFRQNKIALPATMRAAAPQTAEQKVQ